MKAPPVLSTATGVPYRSRMLSVRRSVGTLLVLAVLAASSACSSEPSVEPTSTTAADDVPLPDDVALFKALGCIGPFDEGAEPQGHPGATVRTCTGDLAASNEPRSKVVQFDSDGAKDLYVTATRDALKSLGGTDQHVVGDGPWSVWGSDPDVLAAAIDAGGTLDDD